MHSRDREKSANNSGYLYAPNDEASDIVAVKSAAVLTTELLERRLARRKASGHMESVEAPEETP